MGVWQELRHGLRETRKYLLSHHVPAERYRCYAPRVRGHQIHLCARCSGIYPGIALGVAAQLLELSPLTAFLFVAICPLPALADWHLTTFTSRRGSNLVRTATGALLGYGYGLGLVYLLRGHVLPTLAVAFAYALLAGISLYAAGHRT
ncbi:DUF2085 domain-containing protein [Salinibaculum salinum]|uniref:DUF2085 domain-containing protein n=1 Tax=Salinibaculum salinum TaxID=3131996 RepID=UPI0030EBD7FB